MRSKSKLFSEFEKTFNEYYSHLTESFADITSHLLYAVEKIDVKAVHSAKMGSL